MEIIPAIDIRGGNCVRLQQGDYDRETVFDEDPVSVARQWRELGAHIIHVVDLDGARMGSRINGDIVASIVKAVDCKVQTGGGIRDLQAVRDILNSDVDRFVLGTAAVKDQQFLLEALKIAGDQLIVSVDARDGLVQLEGWTESTDLSATAWIDNLSELGVRHVVYTDISRDGALEGPNYKMYELIATETSVSVIAAGGVTTTDDVRRLRDCGLEAAIIGKALYTGDIDLADAIAAAI